MNHWKKFLSPILHVKRPFFVLILRGAFWGMMGTLVAYHIKYLLDALQAGNYAVFKYHFIIVTVFMIFKSIPAYGVRLARSYFKSGIQRWMYREYLEKYLMITGNEAEKLGTGQSNNIIQRGCDNRMLCLLDIPESYAEIIVSFCFIFGITWKTLGPKFIAVIIILLIITIIIAQYGNKLVTKYREERRDRLRKADRSIVKLIMSKQEILQGDTIAKEIKHIDHEIYMGQSLFQKKADYGLIYSVDIQRFVFDILRLSIAFYISLEILKGTMTIGDFTMFRGILRSLGDNLEKINDCITNYHQKIIYVTKLRDTFDQTPRIKGYDTGETFRFQKGNICLKNIFFGYGETNEIFQDFCLDIPGGKKIALVGSSGSGKTTLMKLIAGYLRPEGGKVMVDGQDLTAVSLKSYYAHIGYLTQEPSIFDGTIRENLEYGVESGNYTIESKNLEDIIKLAKCEFIYDFPLGLETEIGEKGIRLSGGQRQRLAIAKIFLKNPEILLLDEPTSALDSFSENAVTEAMEHLFQGRTVIIIAHRLQTVKSADTILVLEGGEVVETGNHEELFAKNGIYAKMVEMQSGF